MAEYVCCKCFNEFDDSLAECPICDFTVCNGDCVKCNQEASETRYQMAMVMQGEQPFIGSDD